MREEPCVLQKRPQRDPSSFPPGEDTKSLQFRKWLLLNDGGTLLSDFQRPALWKISVVSKLPSLRYYFSPHLALTFSMTWCDEDISCPVVMPQIHSHEKTSGKPQLRYIIQDTWALFLRTVRVLKKQGKTEPPSQIVQDYGETATKCNSVFWTESWERKRTLLETLVTSK